MQLPLFYHHATMLNSGLLRLPASLAAAEDAYARPGSPLPRATSDATCSTSTSGNDPQAPGPILGVTSSLLRRCPS